MVLGPGGANSSTDLPILPPTCASNPALARIWPINAVVVDLPLVPVMAITGALPGLPASGRISRANNSTSPITGTLALPAWVTTSCGRGWVSGTPGLRIRVAIFSQAHSRQGVICAPAWWPASRAPALSSQAITSAPPSFKARTLAKPVRASPNTATIFPGKLLAAIMPLPEFQGGEAGQRQHHRHDPETDHDGGLGPAQLLVMVMDRRHAEDALASELETHHLHDHRHGLEHEQSADNRQHDLMLDATRHRAQRPAQRQGAGVAHEDG